MPTAGQTIFIYFRNGMQLEGTVVSWSDTKSVLKSLTGASIIVIQKTSEDILFYRVSDAKNEYEKIKEKPYKDQEDIKTIASLKNNLNQIERAEIKEKLNTHSPTGAITTNYAFPTNIKVNSTVKHPTEETSRKDTCISSELQGLFSKKH